MKPHVVLRLRPGAVRRDVGSWLRALDDPSVAGPPFAPGVDTALARHPGGVLVVAEHEPAGGPGGAGSWSADERAAGLDRLYRVVALAPRPFSPELLDALAAAPEVEAVAPGLVASAPLPLACPSTAASRRSPSDWAAEAVGLAEAHRVTRGDPDVVIAVLDTGVDLRHPEYADRLLPGRDLVDVLSGAEQFLGDSLGVDADATDPGVGHGSHVAGIAAGRGLRMSPGVAPACRVLPVRVLGALRTPDGLLGAGLVDNINAGIKWAVDAGADVLCMSLGVRHDGGGLPHRDVVRYAARRGVAVVAAAGNDGGRTLYYPGALPGVVAVGAVDRDGEVAGYSTRGEQVDLVAPGTEIWSSWTDGRYASATGTSQATPFVAGALALLRAHARAVGADLPPEAALEVLSATCDRAGTAWRDDAAGAGRLNLPDALALLAARLERRAPRLVRQPRRALVPA